MMTQITRLIVFYVAFLAAITHVRGSMKNVLVILGRRFFLDSLAKLGLTYRLVGLA